MASDTIAQIKERLSIVDVVSSYVELHQAGKNFKGKSPFTAEKTPSFYVSPDRGMYYCFSSSQGGDIFTFIEKMEGVDFKEALKILAQKAGVELVPEDPKKKSERDRLYEALEDATKFFEEYLQKNTEAKTYLEDRGVTAETIAKWRLGYAPGPDKYGWRELKEHAESKGYSKSELLKAGLIKGADAGKEPYDLFRDRIMFPIFDAQGKVVAYSGRILSKTSEAPKYVNSPETELFNKSEILYGYDKAKHGIRHFDFSLVVEGQFDVVLSHQAGYTNTVAVSGTALTPHHVMLLQRLSNRVVLALDADKAGIAAVKRAADVMLPRGMDIKVAQMIGGKDPADLIKDDVQHFRKIIGSAKPVIEYLLDIIEAEKKDDRNFKLRVREEILPVLIKISNKIDQDHFENVIAERLSTTKEAIHFEVVRFTEQAAEKASLGQHNIVPSGEQSKPQALKDPVEVKKRKEELLHYMSVLVSLYPPEKKDILQKAFIDIVGEEPSDVAARIDIGVQSGLSFNLETYLSNTPPKQLAEDVADKFNELSVLITKDRIQELREKLQAAESAGDEASVLEYLKSMSDIQKEQTVKKHTPTTFL
jgi:DNA primase